MYLHLCMPYAYIMQFCYLAFFSICPPQYDLYHFYYPCIMLFTLVPFFFFFFYHPVPWSSSPSNQPVT